MDAPKLTGTIRYRWIDGNSILFFMGKGESRRRAWADRDSERVFGEFIELEGRLWEKASKGYGKKLGEYISIRWLSKTGEFRFYRDNKVKLTIPQDDDTAKFRESISAVFALSKEVES